MMRQAQHLARNIVAPYADLGNFLLALQRLDEARQIIGEAQARKLDDVTLHNALYAVAFLNADSAGMAEQQQWLAAKSEYENFGLALAADTEAYAGHLGTARELTERAAHSAIQADSKESGAIWQENAALREAAFGNEQGARQAAAAGLRLVPGNRDVEVEAALAFALTGDTARAGSMAKDLNQRYPKDLQMQSLWLPTIHAQLALQGRAPAIAIQDLQPAASPIEWGLINFVLNVSCLYPTYIRGQAYLASGQGAAAAAEFQKILDHSGIVWNCWTGALAHLGDGSCQCFAGEELNGSRGRRRPCPRPRRVQTIPHALERRRPRHPDLQASESRIREATLIQNPQASKPNKYALRARRTESNFGTDDRRFSGCAG